MVPRYVPRYVRCGASGSAARAPRAPRGTGVVGGWVGVGVWVWGGGGVGWGVGGAGRAALRRGTFGTQARLPVGVHVTRARAVYCRLRRENSIWRGVLGTSHSRTTQS